MTKPKTAREILVNIFGDNDLFQENGGEFDQALSQLSALINDAVGKDSFIINRLKIGNVDYAKGYNQAKAEIRQRLKEIGL
jgi:protoporphyrinogen oxidase